MTQGKVRDVGCARLSPEVFGRKQHRNKQDGLPALRFRGCVLPEMLQAGCVPGSRQPHWSVVL